MSEKTSTKKMRNAVYGIDPRPRDVLRQAIYLASERLYDLQESSEKPA